MGSTCSVVPGPSPPVPTSVKTGVPATGAQKGPSGAGVGGSTSARQKFQDRRMDLVGPTTNTYRRTQDGDGSADAHSSGANPLDSRGRVVDSIPETIEPNEISLPVARVQRPKTNRPFAELLSKSLLLRYHPDRVAMFTRLRGGCTTPEGVDIPSIKDRLVLRRQEEVFDRLEGAGHLYFVAPERPLPLPIAQIASIDVTAALQMMSQSMAMSGREVTPHTAASELRRHLSIARAQLKTDIAAVAGFVGAVDLDAATLACQQVLAICKRYGLNKLLAVALQIYLCMNDILVIESIGTTFEEAVRAYLAEDHTDAQASGAAATIPDLTTVLELYTLLIGGHPVGTALSAAPTDTDPTRSRDPSVGQPQHATSPQHSNFSAPTAAHPPPLVASAAEGGKGSGSWEHHEMHPVRGQDSDSTRTESHPKFQPTLASPYNFSGSETGIVMLRSQNGGGRHLGSSQNSVLRLSSTGTAVTGGALSTGSFLHMTEFQLPKVLADEGAKEVQLQLIEQVNLMLEVQQMLFDTLEYLIKVAKFHVEEGWRDVV